MAGETRKTSRGARGEGSIFQDRGSWCYQPPPIEVDGIRKRPKVMRGYPTQKAASDAKRQWFRDRDDGKLQDTVEATWSVEKYVRRFFETEYHKHVTADWLDKSLRALELHLFSTPLGRSSIGKATTPMVQAWIDGLPPRSAAKIYTGFRQAMIFALSRGHLTAIPITGVKVQRPKNLKEHHRPIDNTTDFEIFLATARLHRRGALWITLIGAGLRMGEALDLEVGDIDLRGGTIKIRAGKTENATRVLSPPRFVMRALAKQLDERRAGGQWIDAAALIAARQAAGLSRAELAERVEISPSYLWLFEQGRDLHCSDRILRALANTLEVPAKTLILPPPEGAVLKRDDLVFTTRAGKRLSGDNINKEFHAFLKQAGLGDRRPHDLRHSCATLMLLQGAPLHVVSDILGHADITITDKFYAHVPQKQKQEASGLLDALAPDDEL